jgi:multidrug efflux system outer membrane protein
MRRPYLGAGLLLLLGIVGCTVGPNYQMPDMRVPARGEEQRLAQYEQVVLTSLEEVENALVAYSREQVRRRKLTEAVEANQRAVKLANELYIRGLGDFLNVLESQRSLLASQSGLVESEAIMSSNVVALYKALGGGWESD